MTPTTMRDERKNAKLAIRANLANSEAFGARAAATRDLDSLLAFVSVSASESEASVDALVDDLNRCDMMGILNNYNLGS